MPPELVVWQCPKCSWYWVDGDTVDEDYTPSCDKECGKLERIPVVPLAHHEAEVGRLRGDAKQTEGVRVVGGPLGELDAKEET